MSISDEDAKAAWKREQGRVWKSPTGVDFALKYIKPALVIFPLVFAATFALQHFEGTPSTKDSCYIAAAISVVMLLRWVRMTRTR